MKSDPHITYRRKPATLDRSRTGDRSPKLCATALRADASFIACITNDAELQSLNREFRGKDYADRCALVSLGEPPIPRRYRDLAAARPRPGARMGALARRRNPHPDAARRAAPDGHGSRIRLRPDGARRKALAQETRSAHRADRASRTLKLHDPRCAHPAVRC